MGAMLIVKAMMLVSFNSDGEAVNPRAPWINADREVHYSTPGQSVKGRTPWARESLSRGQLPAIAPKGSL